MLVTDYFVYIHTSRTAGTFLNNLMLRHVPGARMIQYHGHLRDLPPQHAHLPVVGLVRNPWDWYVSMFSDYRRKQQYVWQVLSDDGLLGFARTVSRFLCLGDDSELSRKLRQRLIEAAPEVIDASTPKRRANPGLLARHFREFPADQGYYSWLFRLMYETDTKHDVHIGRFENVREETLRLFELTNTPITNEIRRYLQDAPRANASQRPAYFVGGYNPELEKLVEEKDRAILDTYGYEFVEPDIYPKTDFFRELGRADVTKLVERTRALPDSVWQTENRNKPNKYRNLNDARHVMFRFIEAPRKVYDFRDFPLWQEWQDDLLPIMTQAANSLGYSDYRFPRVMLARLPAGGTISPHTDGMASHYIHKIHVPLITNDATIFTVGKESRHIGVGEIVEVNNKRSHAVRNDGDEDRVHLIFECYNVEDYGKPG